ncbi:MAG: peptidoglycan-binding domain-containing protein [Pseudomonadota bacterium]
MIRTKIATALGCAMFLGTIATQAQTQDEALLPPNAKAGECYARVFVPATYEKRTEQVLVDPATEKVDFSKPKYDWVTERVVVQEAYEVLKVVPAEFKWVEERVLVKEASEELRHIPAEYDVQEERILLQPSYVTWKKGRGLIERIDEATGEIMCRVEVPAEYKTVKKRVLKTAARTEKVAVPAEYKTVKRRVMANPPKTVKTTVPAKYDTIKVRKLVEPAREQKVTVPAKYAAVTKTVRTSDAGMEWRSVLCETNAGPGLVADIQRALKSKGYNPGSIDGVMGRATMEAVDAFQTRNGMAAGKLTMETIRALGVKN